MIVYNVQNLPAEMIAAATINREAKSIELMEAFETALASNVFMSFEDKIGALLSSMSIPISDDSSYNMFFIHSTRDMESDAGKQSAKSGSVCILPTLDQIHAEAQKRYDDKAAKDKSREERKAARADKAAKKVPAEQQPVVQ